MSGIESSVETPVQTASSFWPSAAYREKLASHVKDGLKSDMSLYIFIACFLGAGFSYLSFMGRAAESHFFVYYPILFSWIVGCLLPFFAILSALTVQRRLPNQQKRAFRALTTPKNIGRYVNGLIFITAFILFIGMFTAIKTSFGFSFGFKHDVYQADLDKLLFFGQDAWRYLFEPIHSVWTQPLIEFNYNLLWHMHVYAVLYLVATAYPSREFRKRYLFSFMLVWVVIGNLFAGTFISAGPAFYGLVTGDETRFAEQLMMLKSYENSAAIDFQTYLWQSYTDQTTGFGTGISAFPSIHVSLCVLNTFFAFEVSKRLGWASFAYMTIILVSSVYLAWHYLIDGLAGAALVALIYYAMKYVFRDQKQTTH